MFIIDGSQMVKNISGFLGQLTHNHNTGWFYVRCNNPDLESYLTKMVGDCLFVDSGRRIEISKTRLPKKLTGGAGYGFNLFILLANRAMAEVGDLCLFDENSAYSGCAVLSESYDGGLPVLRHYRVISGRVWERVF